MRSRRRREQTIAHRRPADGQAQAGEQTLGEAAGARLIEVDEVNPAVGRDDDVLGSQVVVAHAPARERPDQPDQAQHDLRELEPADLETAEGSSRYPLHNQDLAARILDQLKRRRYPGETPAAPQHRELAARILPALTAWRGVRDCFVESIIGRAQGALWIEGIGAAFRFAKSRRRIDMLRATRCRRRLVRHARIG